MCFFIVYLLKIITNIIKANTIIVSTTKLNKSRYIISNKTASIITSPPHSHEDKINYNLYIEQNNIKIELNIKYVGSDKIKLLIDNLETKNITVTQQ